MTDQLRLPLARHTDPDTSHEAAGVVAGGNAELVRLLRQACRMGPWTAYELVDIIDRAQPNRWAASTIISAIARAGLERADICGTSPRGRRVAMWKLKVQDTEPL